MASSLREQVKRATAKDAPAATASTELASARTAYRGAGGCRMNGEVRKLYARLHERVARDSVDPRARRELLDEAVALAPDFQLLMAAGEAADVVNDLRAARAHFDEAELKARTRAEQAAARWRLAALDKKLGVEGSFASRENLHFVVRFEGDERKDLAEATLAILDEVRPSLRDRLGLEPPAPITVVLYVGDQYARATNGPDWSGGLFDGKIRVRESQLKLQRGQLRDLLVHEYVHALLATSLPKQRWPAWFNEGLAQYCEPGQDRSRMERRRSTTKQSAVPSLAALTRNFSAQADGAVARSYYDYALDLVDEMVRWRGERSLVSFFEAMRKGKDFAAAFDDVYGMNLELFESRWRSRYQ